MLCAETEKLADSVDALLTPDAYDEISRTMPERAHIMKTLIFILAIRALPSQLSHLPFWEEGIRDP